MSALKCRRVLLHREMNLLVPGLALPSSLVRHSVPALVTPMTETRKSILTTHFPP